MPAVKLYGFEESDHDLTLLPLCARRALDRVGLHVSLEAWQRLAVERRRELARLGSADRVELARVRELLTEVEPAPREILPVPEPSAEQIPPEVTQALGSERHLSVSAWAALEPLDRYALLKVCQKPRPGRLAAAYAEIVGQSAASPHLDATGAARMIGVSHKASSARRAVAESAVRMSPEAMSRLMDAPKGDVLATARLAGIMAAKRTAELIPLCHPLALTRVAVELRAEREASTVCISATVEAFDRTGVEMEALTAASVAALTVYDMLKAFDKAMEIGPTRLTAKSGGRSGDFQR